MMWRVWAWLNHSADSDSEEPDVSLQLRLFTPPLPPVLEETVDEIHRQEWVNTVQLYWSIWSVKDVRISAAISSEALE